MNSKDLMWGGVFEVTRFEEDDTTDSGSAMADVKRGGVTLQLRAHRVDAPYIEPYWFASLRAVTDSRDGLCLNLLSERRSTDRAGAAADWPRLMGRAVGALCRLGLLSFEAYEVAAAE